MISAKEIEAEQSAPQYEMENEDMSFEEILQYKEPEDKPCVMSCCLCCNLGIGTILTSILFLIFNGIYVMRQMTSLNAALGEGETPELQFDDGHLDAIFAFVGIALSGVAGLAAFILLFFSFCFGVAEEVGKVKVGAFSWTVATGLSSIWILGEAIYRTVPQDDQVSSSSGLGYIIVTNINEVQAPEGDESKELIVTWLLAGFYLLFYMYFSVVVMSYVHVLSRTSAMTQKDHLAIKQGMQGVKSDSPALSARSYGTESGLIQRQFSSVGYPNQPHQYENYGQQFQPMGMVQDIYQQQPEMMPNMYPQQMVLPPMFSEQVIAGPQGQPISVIVDPTGQIVPAEIAHQIIMSHNQQLHQQQQMAMMHGAQSECNSVITDCTYRSGAPLMQNEMIGVERQRSVRFQEHPQTRYIQENSVEVIENQSPEIETSSGEEMSTTSSRESASEMAKKKGVRFSLYTEEVETSPYPAEQPQPEPTVDDTQSE